MCRTEFFDSWREQKRKKEKWNNAPVWWNRVQHSQYRFHLFEKHWSKRKNGRWYNNFLQFPSTRRSSMDNHGAITARNAYYQSSIVQTSGKSCYVYIPVNEKSVHEWYDYNYVARWGYNEWKTRSWRESGANFLGLVESMVFLITPRMRLSSNRATTIPKQPRYRDRHRVSIFDDYFSSVRQRFLFFSAPIKIPPPRSSARVYVSILFMSANGNNGITCCAFHEWIRIDFGSREE